MMIYGNQGENGGWIGLAVARPIAVLMLTIAIVVFGYVSYHRLPINLMPDISYPSITVRTEYSGSPLDVEEMISKPIEQAVGVINGLVNIASISRADVSDIVLDFSWGTDMDDVSQSIREKLGQVFLPKEATKPLLLRYDPTLDPILRLGVHGEDNEFSMRYMAEEEIKREVESISGVAAVKVRGGLEQQITVALKRSLLEKYQLDIAEVYTRLKEENLNIAAGRLQEAESEYLVRSLNQFTSIPEIRNLAIARRGKQKIYLRDIASVNLSHKTREVITRINGKISVEIAIYKEGDANLVNVADKVKLRLFGDGTEKKRQARRNLNSQGIASDAQPLAKRLPGKMQLAILSDQSTFIKRAIDEVKSTAIIGALLAMAILFIFLRKIATTLIISIAIPISIVVTFAPMHIYGISLNIMSLGGLALGVGMLVDTSIVVLEAIFRRREQGEPFVSSAVNGTQEVAGAVVAATLTTISVFFPIVFVEGIAGQIFRDQALAVVFSLIASLGVSLSLIPMLATREFHFAPNYKLSWCKWHSGSELRKSLRIKNIWLLLLLPINIVRGALFFSSELLGKLLLTCFVVSVFVLHRIFILGRWLLRPLVKVIFTTTNRGLEILHHWYSRSLRWALHHKMLILWPTVLLFAISLLLLEHLGRELIPKMNQGEFTVKCFLPIGTPLEKSDKVLKPIESLVGKQDGVALVSSTIGVSKEELSALDEGEHTGKISVRLLESHLDRETSIIDVLRADLQNRPELYDVQITHPSLFSLKTPIEVEVRGYNLQLLKNITRQVSDAMRQIKGFHDVRANIKRGNPELQIIYDRKLLAQYNLNIDTISRRIKNFLGEVATEYMERDKNIDIVVQLENAETITIRELENLVVTEFSPQKKRLREIATILRVEGFSEIRRINHQRAALISAEISGLDLSSAIYRLQQKLARIPIPEDFQLLITGQSKEMEVSLKSLKFALSFAIFLVYVVLASQFESLLHPFVIILTLPLALIGILWTLYFMQIPISIVVYLGMILLAGIVVNNAIVLITCINQLIQRGMAVEDAVIQAGKLRLRPILMTTLTTILGLLPMAGIVAIGSGEGQEIRAPMAITVIAGLTSSTLLTLLVVPVVYTSFEELKKLFGISMEKK